MSGGRIYLDISAAVHRRAGLGRYADRLTRALLARPGAAEWFSLFYNQEAGVEPLPGLEHWPQTSVRHSYKSWRLMVWAGQLLRLNYARLVPGVCLFHAMEHLLMPLGGVPTVLTVHDLIFERFPQLHKPLNYHYLHRAMPLFVRRARHLIAVSQATKKDLMAFYGVPGNKISVIYEAADDRFRPLPAGRSENVRRKYRLPDDFLLFVGTIEPRKNLERLLDAFATLRRAGVVRHLVIVGKKGWLYEAFFRHLEESDQQDHVIFPGYISDEDLPAVYNAARLFVFPSLYEGFGLPLLEAMACGTPAVSSDRSSLPEVGGDAPLYADPEDTEALADQIRRGWEDASLRQVMRGKGLARAKEFSWARAAAETDALYQLTVRGQNPLGRFPIPNSQFK